MGLKPPSTTGVLLMAYGSPDSLDQMEAYLLDVREGRPTPPSLVEEIKRRYAQIGGRSPLLDITRRQAAALEAELNRRKTRNARNARNARVGACYRAYVGMRHWEPRIAEAVTQIAADGVEKVVALVMAPHSSKMSSGMYFARLEQAIKQQNACLQVIKIPSWHKQAGLIEAIAQHASDALSQFAGERPYIVFTAHSLPSRILAQGDPYDAQLRETAALVAARMGWPLGRFQFCYQSAGQNGEEWMGPRIEDVVVRLAELGEKNILVVPVGFVCDHVEVLYDIDIVARQLAASRGVHLERSASLNDSPVFIRALSDLVESHAGLLVD